MEEQSKQIRKSRNQIDPAGTMPLFLYPVVDGQRVKKGGHISKGPNIISILSDIQYFYKHKSIREFIILDTRDSACVHLNDVDVLNAINFLRGYRAALPGPPCNSMCTGAPPVLTWSIFAADIWPVIHTEPGDLERFHKKLHKLGGI